MMDLPMDTVIAVNDKDLTEALIAEHPGRDFRHWPFGDKMAHWLEYQSKANFDLWSDKYRPSVSRLGLRAFMLPVVILAAAFVAKLGFDTYRYLSLHAEIRSLHAESQEVLKSVFPDFDGVQPGQERALMEQAISRMGGADKSKSMQGMLADAATVLRRQNVTLSNMVYRNSELVITCQLNDFSQVDQLTNQLNARPRLRATLQSSAADGGDIIASYALVQP